MIAILSITILLLLACAAFFSSSETALFSLNSLQIRRMKRTWPRAATGVERLMAEPRKVLSTLLIGNTVASVSAAALGFALAERLVPHYGEAIAVPAMTLILLVLGEVAPKRLAMLHPERLAALNQGILHMLIRVLSPARRLLEGATRIIEKYLPRRPKSLSEDEFRTVVEVGEEEGVVAEEEKTMVEGIIRLEESHASDVMTPRVDLVGIDLDDPLAQIQSVARSVTFRYLPIYRRSLDQAEGFLDVPRYLLSGATDFEAARLPPHFVPETASLDSLLMDFQREHRRVAFVVDEYGGTAGLVTRGDMLEVIAPDIDNEYGTPKLSIQPVRHRAWLIQGNTSLEDINHELDLQLEAEGVDRIAGWFVAHAQHLPRPSEVVEAQGCRVTAQRVRRRRVTLVLLEQLDSPPKPEETQSHV